ncbi:xanthine dehydrogenase accessory protein XdhC [Roseiconus nitratireducens]|uniref:Xanthine dehydrogenase accessory protein XdhC n=1 Tax=Roseiconus nitratireducens TaxID=2605748 RepID=A0A5M6DKF7_9BACT|nr:xanthine dehydrogenase accessory protein XdhC [Roseiconus nitratireducens]KAA5546856.1 xanthine dehydrogenase accessory protein XdhC [Roseiconus nitratireducens]
MPVDFHRHARIVQELLDDAGPFVVVTLADARGSAPQVVGAKAVVTPDGLVSGTIGGGRVEARAIRHAQAMLQSSSQQDCQLVTWNLQSEIGMTCGGEVRLLFEAVNRLDWRIVIFGAGHVAQSLIPMLLQLPCTVKCLDTRTDWLSRLPAHPRLEAICGETLADHVQPLDSRSFFLLMTQGHATDLPILAEILKNKTAPYVGVIGSLQKAKVLRRDLEKLDVSEQSRASFHCPVGLPLGNNTPPEISVSILAQLIQERDRLGVIRHKTKQF